MNCDICGRPHNRQRLPFLCPVDARNRLYEPRLAHAVSLIKNEQLEQQVNAELLSVPDPDKVPVPKQKQKSPLLPQTASERSRVDAWAAERQAIQDRTDDVVARAKQLKADMQAARAALEQRKETVQQRRSDLAKATNGMAARRARMQGEVERSIGMSKYRWNLAYGAMAATRGFLCLEAAKLYGLRRLKKGSHIRYEIGGVEVIDPYTMNNLPPEVVSTSLAHVTHILMLACHYLSIRLPAEVTLPHRDYPRPTIFSLSSSYSHGDVPFPGTPSFQPPVVSLSGGGGSGNSRGRDGRGDKSQDQHSQQQLYHMPRARPLFVDKFLPALAKEDGSAHTMFLEGVALLAYDIAWACQSQGVSIDSSGGDSSSKTSSFDDVFHIGRNLYSLLIGSQLLNNPADRIFSNPSGTQTAAGWARIGGGNSNGNGDEADGNDFSKGTMGRYSHGTAHTFLGDGMTQNFKLPSPNRLADRLKTRLSSESTMPDWEVLEDEAWASDDDHNNMEDGVLNKGQRRRSKQVDGKGHASKGAADSGSADTAIHLGGGSNRRLFGVESMATVITNLEDTVPALDADAHPSSRVPEKPRGPSTGTSGWTKLRNR